MSKASVQERVRRGLGNVLRSEIVPRWREPRYAQSTYLRRFLTEFDVDCILDVGANVGQYHDYLRTEVGFSGFIISFEPHPMCAEKLKERAVHDKQWTVHDHALGESDGRLIFNLTADSQFSSFLQPDNAKLPDLSRSNTVERQVEVRVARLDDLFEGLRSATGFKRPFLKLDTQGYDIAVAKGASSSLEHFCGVQSEVSNVPIYQGMPALSDTCEFFRGSGYELGALFPTNPEQFPISIDFDAYFVSKRHFGSVLFDGYR